MEKEYEKKSSIVDVTFTDGTVQSYNISAGSRIARYLAQQASDSGVLTLLSEKSAVSIPTHNIREWQINEIDEEQEKSNSRKKKGK